jgi:predicted DCC family thiol-disulfide oxidoreductase YuxK
MKHDASGRAFRFAPLQGLTFLRLIDTTARAQLPDSMVILTSGGDVLMRSDAAIHMLRAAGGGWSMLGAVFAIVPRAIRDAAYDAVAAVRYRIFGRKRDLCPVMTPEQRERFDP